MRFSASIMPELSTWNTATVCARRIKLVGRLGIIQRNGVDVIFQPLGAGS